MADHPLVRVGVGVFVFKDGMFLFGQRKNAHWDGTWSVPGGHLEFGESLQDTARREVEEETGVAIKNIRFGALTNDRFPTEGKHYITIWMLSDFAGGSPQIREPDKFVELRWVSFDNLPEPLFLPWHQLLASEFIDAIRNECACSIVSRPRT